MSMMICASSRMSMCVILHVDADVTECDVTSILNPQPCQQPQQQQQWVGPATALPAYTSRIHRHM